MNIQDEPVVVSGGVALAVGLVLLAAIGWSQGLDVRAIIGQVASVALTSIGGLSWARAHVYTESSVQVREQLARATARDDHDRED